MVELRTPSGRNVHTGNLVPQQFDEIVLDGYIVIGFSIHGDNKIHWHYYKNTLPPAARAKAIQLVRERNARITEGLVRSC